MVMKNIYLANSFSIASAISSLSGFTALRNLLTNEPSFSIKNFSKFHSISPSKSGFG